MCPRYVQRLPPTVLTFNGANFTGGVPVVTLGGIDGSSAAAVYVGTGTGVCRVSDNAPYVCLDVLPFDDGLEGNRSQGPVGDHLPIPGDTSKWALVGTFFSLVADPQDPDVVYHAFQRRENDNPNVDDELDVWFDVIGFNPGTNELSASARILVPSTQDDSYDQFGPSLTVSQDKHGVPTVFATWYDRNATAAGCGGTDNRCYMPRSAIYLPTTQSFGYHQDIYVEDTWSVSDPIYLPTRCGALSGEHFLGDYHHVAADRLHSFQTVVGAPRIGSVYPTATLSRAWVSRGFWYGGLP